MPIRINLLAESQAAEEQRRKDPVKRALWISGGLVTLMVLWCVLLQTRILAAHAMLKHAQTQWNKIEPSHKVVVESRRKTIELEQKLAALERLHTNRFLLGNTLNALQQTFTSVDNVRLTRVKMEQAHALVEEARSRKQKNASTNKVYTAREKITLTLDAIDSNQAPGTQVNRYKEAIAATSYFETSLQKTNGVLLTTLSPPQVTAEEQGAYVNFTLQCYFPEKIHH